MSLGCLVCVVREMVNFLLHRVGMEMLFSGMLHYSSLYVNYSDTVKVIPHHRVSDCWEMDLYGSADVC